MSEALILQSVNPQYNDRLFIDSWLQYKKNTTSEHVVYKHCFLFMFWSSKQCLYTTCSQLVFFLYWIQEWMHNLSSYCGLTYSRISASEKDLPVYTECKEIRSRAFGDKSMLSGTLPLAFDTINQPVTLLALDTTLSKICSKYRKP